MSEPEIQQAQRRQRAAVLIQRVANKQMDDAAAVAEIQALATEDFAELLKNFLVLFRLKRIFPLVTCGILLCAVGVEILLSQNGAHLLGITGGLFALAAAVGTLRVSTVTNRLMTQLEDVRVVGPLAEALLVANRSTQPYLIDTLTRLLPNLGEADAALLTPKQRVALYRALLKEYPLELVVAILDALKKIGDSTAIPYVSRLAQRKASARQQESVRQAALDCLEILEENKARKRRQETLVRAAEPPAQNILLRPAGSAGDVEPQQLLRAVSSSDQIPVDTNNPTVSGTEEEARLPLSN